MKRRFWLLSVGLVQLSSIPLLATDVSSDKENVFKDSNLQLKKSHIDHTSKSVSIQNTPKETLRLEGQATEEGLLKLQDPRYNAIYLHCFYSMSAHPAFTDDSLNVSTDTVNAGLSMLSYRASGLHSVNILRINELSNLTAIDLAGNVIDIEGVKSIAQLQKVWYLDLSDNRLNNKAVEFLSAMESLVQLSLCQNRNINDDGIKYLIPHNKLKKLNIEFTQVSEEGCFALRKNGLQVIYFPL